MKKSKKVIQWLDGLAIHRKLVLEKVNDMQAQWDRLNQRFNELANDKEHFEENAYERHTVYDEMVVLERDIRPFRLWLEETDILLSHNIYMNRYLHTDITPWEVVEMITPRKFVIREMNAIETEASRQARTNTFEPDGFMGHTDNDVQDWNIFPNDNPDTYCDVIVRKHKDGYWYDVHGNKYQIDSKPRKFYDFNF